MKEGICSPTQIADAFLVRYMPKDITRATLVNRFNVACHRLGLDKTVAAEQVEEQQQAEPMKDIEEYEQVKAYKRRAEEQHLTEREQSTVLISLRDLWEMMGKTNPESWTYEEILERLKLSGFKKITDVRGRTVWEHQAAVLQRLGALNRMFAGIIPKGFSGSLRREAGELKDYFSFEEVELFLSNLTDTTELSKEGWLALFTAQLNLGCREGSHMETGILSLRWEDIDFKTRRTSLLEKGKKGFARRRWVNLPLDLFTWLHGFEHLFNYWDICGQLESGRVFPIRYELYIEQFNRTRKLCNSRISGDKETFVPHVLRKTHAQWLVKLWTPIELICGQFPNGYYGVGWDSPQILLKYYVTLEGEQFEKSNQVQQARMIVLGLAKKEEFEHDTN